MNVANLQNSKRLYELSGWEYPSCSWTEHGAFPLNHEMRDVGVMICPAYNSGYLLRKLPKKLEDKGWLVLIAGQEWGVGFDYLQPTGKMYIPIDADTPEDALCLLAIKLFEEGILKK